jgi:hypothetical protein
MVKLKRKIILTKKNIIKRIRTKLKKTMYHKLGLEDEIKNQ